MPPAVLAWLDHSDTDQRRARELIATFSQRESRDELGLGGIRDALSDTLFPGISVLLTRAPYLLFVPSLFREGARRGYRGPQLASWVDGQQRRLIDAVRTGGNLGGLIGRNVGPAVRILPSTILLEQPPALRHLAARGDGGPGRGSPPDLADAGSPATASTEASMLSSTSTSTTSPGNQGATRQPMRG